MLESYRSIIKGSKPDNEVQQRAKQGKNAKIDKRTMYRIRYEMAFEGLSIAEAARRYDLEYRYALYNVAGYRTMSLVVPKREVKPDNYQP